MIFGKLGLFTRMQAELKLTLEVQNQMQTDPILLHEKPKILNSQVFLEIEITKSMGFINSHLKRKNGETAESSYSKYMSTNGRIILDETLLYALCIHSLQLRCDTLPVPPHSTTSDTCDSTMAGSTIRTIFH